MKICLLTKALLHWHSAEPAPYHLRGLNNWLDGLIGFPLSCIETGYFIFWCATSFCLFLSAMSSHKWRIKRGERAVVAKLLITIVNNKPQVC